jgi:hypothetical protein
MARCCDGRGEVSSDGAAFGAENIIRGDSYAGSAGSSTREAVRTSPPPVSTQAGTHLLPKPSLASVTKDVVLGSTARLLTRGDAVRD